jgi:DNA-binding CsgD family transcriptional regulator
MQESLTGREQEVLNMLLDGAVPKEIALSLNISYDTVLAHQKSLYRKLDVHSINELMGKYSPDNPGVKHSSNKKNSTESVFIKKLDFISGVFFDWFYIKDDLSSVDFSIGEETEEGQTFVTYSLSGCMYEKNGSFAGVVMVPDSDTLNAMRSMSSFSFKVLGDGNSYLVCLPTTDTRINGDHHMMIFSTIKDKISTITVKIDKDLVEWGWTGNPYEFVKENITHMQFQAVRAGQFNLKFWDIRLYP